MRMVRRDLRVKQALMALKGQLVLLVRQVQKETKGTVALRVLWVMQVLKVILDPKEMRVYLALQELPVQQDHRVLRAKKV